jgi:2-keto-4-pentenoate hydratase/2-oxohepta-3-ene-1,7-dioic acid hydratase in catechol pathway
MPNLIIHPKSHGIHSVNGELRQKSSTNCFLFDIPTLLEFTSKTVTLEPGDLLLTGTPAGVGPVKSGDQIEIGITGISTAVFTVA